MLRNLLLIILQLQFFLFAVTPVSAFINGRQGEWAKLYERAEQLLDRNKIRDAEIAINKSLQVQDGSTVHKILSLELLSEIHEKRKSFKDEELVMCQMFEQMKSIVFPNNITALTCLKIADLNFALKDYTAAKKYYEQSLPLLKMAFGQNSVEFILAMNNLAFTEVQSGKLSDAANRFLETLSLIDSVQGNECELYGRVATNLADLYEQLEEWNSARLWYEKAITAFRQACGEGDPMVLQLERHIVKFQSAEKGSVTK